VNYRKVTIELDIQHIRLLHQKLDAVKIVNHEDQKIMNAVESLLESIIEADK
jgi:N-acetylmuramic acid 6-phosphate (MurNAc-6-P) etherase